MTTRVLITGGAGFIGSHLSQRLLQDGVRVRVLDNLSPQIHGHLPTGLDRLADSDIDFVRGSVTRRSDLASALVDVDCVIHLAAETGTGQSMYDIARYNEVNSQGTAILMDILANDPGRTVNRILLASSRSVYGEGAYVCDGCGGATAGRQFPKSRSGAELARGQWDPPCAQCGKPLRAVATLESDPSAPASIYAASKLAQEDLVRIGCESLGIGYGIFRLQNVYGQGQSLKNPYTGILSIFSTRIRRRLPLTVFEDGQETRDFVHVSDVVSAFAAAVGRKQAPDCVMNVGTGTGVSILDIADALNRAFAGQSDISVTGEYRIGDIRHNFADTSRLKQVLGIAAGVSLQTGLDQFADWVLQQPLPEDLLPKANAELAARRLKG